MKNDNRSPLRILIVDDEKIILDLYQKMLSVQEENESLSGKMEEFADILFGEKKSDTSLPSFNLELCSRAYEAVEAVKKSIEDKKPFAVAFLDIRMPPGPDGIWVAEQIRALDSTIEIVMVTGFSDVDPLDIAKKVPPAHKLLYLQKPFHRQEIYQFAYALGAKWEMEQKLKQTEEKKKELESQLRRSQKLEAIGTLAGGIAHDFNNILSSIIGNAEIALHHELSEKDPARHSVEQIIKASHRAKNLIQQIITFSRQKDQELKPFNIIPIMKETIKLLRSSLPATIEIRQKILTNLDTVLCEPGQIQQVLMNLCTNAAYAMREKGGVLEIKLNDTLSSLDMDFEKCNSINDIRTKPYLKLTVNDTGYGMPPLILERIFEPYFTTKPIGEGTGLGLSVVHGIVKTLNGIIQADSVPGKGSTFNVFFPIVEKKTMPIKPTYQDEYIGGSERILFIDNEDYIVNMGMRMLEGLGYKVTAKSDSAEALKTFRSDPKAYDLVITDMTMPGITGDKLAQKILKIRPDIPIILCTGYSENITEEKAKEIGIREFALKPIVMKDLAHIIRKAIEKR